MSQQKKSIQQINEKLAAGEANVLTQYELLTATQDGAVISAAELDVVIMAFRSSIASSAAMLLVPVAGRGVFTRAKQIWLNGVEGFPGPAPNERLGLVDTLIFSEQPSRDESVFYTGAHLFLDLLGDEGIDVECLTEEGDTYYNSFKISDLEFARMYNYNTFIPVSTTDMDDPDSVGCGYWSSIHIGDKIMMNKATGIIAGPGTRSSRQSRSLSLVADMFTMDTKMLNGTEPEESYSLFNTIAIPIPVLDDTVIQSITKSVLQKTQDGKSQGPHQHELELSQILKDEMLAMRFKLADSAMELGD